MKILLWLAASAVDEPEMPAKEHRQHDVDLGQRAGPAADQCARQGHQPVGDAAHAHQVAVSRKNGTARRMKEL
jgi:hypothetical protein